jgi:hypothetical protein
LALLFASLWSSTTDAADLWQIDAQTAQLESHNANTSDNTTLRLWTPPGIAKLRGVIVCGPGANQQGTDVGLKYAQLERWRVLAQRHAFALVGVQWTSYTGGNPLNAADPSDDLEVALQNIGTATNHPELAVVPVVTWGMSASGGFSFGYALDRPKRCLAFCDNKGESISAYLAWGQLTGTLDELYAQAVPGLLCYDENGLYSCATETGHLGTPDTVANSYVTLRNGHGLITMIPDWKVGHVEWGYGQCFALSYFDRIIEARLPSDYQPGTAATLVKLSENDGWLGACNNFGYRIGGQTGQNVGSYSRAANPTIPAIIKRSSFTGSDADAFNAMTYTWLPDEYLAHLWQAASIYTHAAKVSSPNEWNSNVADPAYVFSANATANISAAAQNNYILTGVTWFDGLTQFDQNTTGALNTTRQMSFGLHPVYAAVTTSSGTPSISGFSLLCGQRGTPTAPTFTTKAMASPTSLSSISGSVTLSALAIPSDGGLDCLITYTWSKNSGPGSVTFGNGNGQHAASSLSASFSAYGTYVIDVVASNAEGLTSTSQITVTVTKASQTITFPTISTQTYGAAPLTLSATASSGLPVTFSVVSGPASVDGSTLTITGAGNVVIAANQAGNANYTAAQQVTQTITVTKASQTITFPTISTQTYGAAPLTLSATASSGLPVTFSVVSGPASVDGSTLTITEAGNVVIAANQAGNANYAAAQQVMQTITIAKASQTITFPTISTQTYGAAPLTLSATASSGLPVTFSVVNGPASVDGSTLTITGAGNVVIAADQAGNANYTPAPQVTQTVTVASASAPSESSSGGSSGGCGLGSGTAMLSMVLCAWSLMQLHRRRAA